MATSTNFRISKGIDTRSVSNVNGINVTDDIATTNTDISFAAATGLNIMNKANSPLVIGTNNTAAITIAANGYVTIAGSTSSGNHIITGAAATNRAMYFNTVATNRWMFGTDAAAESGSNAGTNFIINRYDDTGAFVDRPMTINRSTGAITFVGAISGNGSGLTTLNASNLSSGTVATARLGTGTADSTTYLRGDSTWATVSAGATLSAVASETALYLGLSANTSGTWTAAKVATTLFYDASTSTLNAANFNSTSDERLKDNIASISGAVETVKQLRGVSFTWKSSEKPAFGVIAQEIEKVLPELVDMSDIKDGLSDQRSVNYNGLIGFLIEAVKEQQVQIDELTSMIKGN